MRIGVGGVAKLMVHVRDTGQLQSAFVAQRDERMQEHHRVGAA